MVQCSGGTVGNGGPLRQAQQVQRLAEHRARLVDDEIVMGQEQHLRVRRKGLQFTQARGGALSIEGDEQVVRDERQGGPAVEVHVERGEAQRKIELVAGALAHLAGVDVAAVGPASTQLRPATLLVHHQSIEGSQRQARETRRGPLQQRSLALVAELAQRPVEHPAGDAHLQVSFGRGRQTGDRALPVELCRSRATAADGRQRIRGLLRLHRQPLHPRGFFAQPRLQGLQFDAQGVELLAGRFDHQRLEVQSVAGRPQLVLRGADLLAQLLAVLPGRHPVLEQGQRGHVRRREQRRQRVADHALFDLREGDRSAGLLDIARGFEPLPLLLLGRVECRPETVRDVGRRLRIRGLPRMHLRKQRGCLGREGQQLLRHGDDTPLLELLDPVQERAEITEPRQHRLGFSDRSRAQLHATGGFLPVLLPMPQRGLRCGDVVAALFECGEGLGEPARSALPADGPGPVLRHRQLGRARTPPRQPARLQRSQFVARLRLGRLRPAQVVPDLCERPLRRLESRGILGALDAAVRQFVGAADPATELGDRIGQRHRARGDPLPQVVAIQTCREQILAPHQRAIARARARQSLGVAVRLPEAAAFGTRIAQRLPRFAQSRFDRIQFGRADRLQRQRTAELDVHLRQRRARPLHLALGAQLFLAPLREPGHALGLLGDQRLQLGATRRGRDPLPHGGGLGIRPAQIGQQVAQRLALAGQLGAPAQEIPREIRHPRRGRGEFPDRGGRCEHRCIGRQRRQLLTRPCREDFLGALRLDRPGNPAASLCEHLRRIRRQGRQGAQRRELPAQHPELHELRRGATDALQARQRAAQPAQRLVRRGQLRLRGIAGIVRGTPARDRHRRGLHGPARLLVGVMRLVPRAVARPARRPDLLGFSAQRLAQRTEAADARGRLEELPPRVIRALEDPLAAGAQARVIEAAHALEELARHATECGSQHAFGDLAAVRILQCRLAPLAPHQLQRTSGHVQTGRQRQFRAVVAERPGRLVADAEEKIPERRAQRRLPGLVAADDQVEVLSRARELEALLTEVAEAGEIEPRETHGLSALRRAARSARASGRGSRRRDARPGRP